MADNRTRRSQPPARKQDRKRRSILACVLAWLAGFGLLAALALFAAVYFTERSLPSYPMLQSSQAGQMIIVRARDGAEIASLGPSYGKWLSYDEIPPIMRDAIISVEDRRYYSHFGVDVIGLARALWVAFEDDRRIGATSTITQQLARNIFLNNSRTYTRKLREALLAMAMERKFTKEQILELYLNKVYFGGGAYGIDSASRLFFSHPATELSTAEAAIIAGLVKAPSRYSPTADAEAAVSRARVVLSLMEREGVITRGEAARVDLDAVRLKDEPAQNSVRYFTDWALPQLDLLIPDNFEPIEVWTTLDVPMQRAATTAIKANTPGGAQGALVSLDRDGAVLAMVGGTDYVESNYNRATQALRQPGSAWKIFVYLAALEAGFTPDSPVEDSPITIEGWTPRNSGGRYAGRIDVRSAFAYSKNTVAARLGAEVGFGTVASMARRFGITTPISTYPSMVLGASETRVIDMTRAFASISAGGNSITPYGIARVTTADGEILYEREEPREQLLVAPYVAAGITDLLQTAVNIGTGRAADIGRPVAGKTGTTSSNKDGWFLGFSSGITTGVWMGRDDAKAVPGLQGGAAPARAFAAYMQVATARRPVEQFETELILPGWQLEPDDEAWFADPDEYYLIDEYGNPIEPYGREAPAPGVFNFTFPDERRESGQAIGGQGPGPGLREPRSYENRGEPGGSAGGRAGGGRPQPSAPPAVGEDFLDRAIGRAAPPNPAPRAGPDIGRLPGNQLDGGGAAARDGERQRIITMPQEPNWIR